jgi:hypothetical protein
MAKSSHIIGTVLGFRASEAKSGSGGVATSLVELKKKASRE